MKRKLGSLVCWVSILTAVTQFRKVWDPDAKHGEEGGRYISFRERVGEEDIEAPRLFNGRPLGRTGGLRHFKGKKGV